MGERTPGGEHVNNKGVGPPLRWAGPLLVCNEARNQRQARAGGVFFAFHAPLLLVAADVTAVLAVLAV